MPRSRVTEESPTGVMHRGAAEDGGDWHAAICGVAMQFVAVPNDLVALGVALRAPVPDARHITLNLRQGLAASLFDACELGRARPTGYHFAYLATTRAPALLRQRRCGWRGGRGRGVGQDGMSTCRRRLFNRNLRYFEGAHALQSPCCHSCDAHPFQGCGSTSPTSGQPFDFLTQSGDELFLYHRPRCNSPARCVAFTGPDRFSIIHFCQQWHPNRLLAGIIQ